MDGSWEHIGPDDQFGSRMMQESVYDYIQDRFVRHYRNSSDVKAQHLLIIKNMVYMIVMNLPSNTPRRVYDKILEHADALIDAAFPLNVKKHVRPPTGEPMIPDDGELPEHYEYHYQRREQLYRNGRWGTCSGCPQVNGVPYPEECEFTDRYDHNLK